MSSVAWRYFDECAFFGFVRNLLLPDFENDVVWGVVNDKPFVSHSVDEELRAKVVCIKEAASVACYLNAKSIANFASFFALILDLSELPNSRFSDGIL